MDRAEEIVAQVMERVALKEHAPGLAWGLVRDGGLVASGGVGTLRIGDDAPPKASSVFRIASMTKSFTGAALMSLVANGDVRLDKPVATYLPAVAGWPAPTTDAPTLTVRHLVSMESGLPTDDAWADRHLDLAQDEMDALIADGRRLASGPRHDLRVLEPRVGRRRAGHPGRDRGGRAVSDIARRAGAAGDDENDLGATRSRRGRRAVPLARRRVARGALGAR